MNKDTPDIFFHPWLRFAGYIYQFMRSMVFPDNDIQSILDSAHLPKTANVTYRAAYGTWSKSTVVGPLEGDLG